MSDLLSVSASAFAVVGLADVVLRTGRECCQFLCAIRDAPSEVRRLQNCVQETALLVHNSKKYCEELKVSTLSTQSSSCPPASNQVIALFTSASKGLKREYSALEIVAKRHNATAKTWGRIKWVLDERRLAKSLSRLEASKSSLVAALIFVGRLVDSSAKGQSSTERADIKMLSIRRTPAFTCNRVCRIWRPALRVN